MMLNSLPAQGPMISDNCGTTPEALTFLWEKKTSKKIKSTINPALKGNNKQLSHRVI